MDEEKKIKGILIDSTNRTITEVEFVPKLESYYRLIGCDLIDCVQYDEHHDVVVDDEGLLKEPTNFFKIDSYDGLLAGNGIIVGVDEDGSWISHSLEKVRVGFVGKKKQNDD